MEKAFISPVSDRVNNMNISIFYRKLFWNFQKKSKGAISYIMTPAQNVILLHRVGILALLRLPAVFCADVGGEPRMEILRSPTVIVYPVTCLRFVLWYKLGWHGFRPLSVDIFRHKLMVNFLYLELMDTHAPVPWTARSRFPIMPAPQRQKACVFYLSSDVGVSLIHYVTADNISVIYVTMVTAHK